MSAIPNEGFRNRAEEGWKDLMDQRSYGGAVIRSLMLFKTGPFLEMFQSITGFTRARHPP